MLRARHNFTERFHGVSEVETGGPAAALILGEPLMGEPLMGGAMVEVGRPGQGEQYVDVQ